jgi:excisionase family DNA binding protein
VWPHSTRGRPASWAKRVKTGNLGADGDLEQPERLSGSRVRSADAARPAGDPGMATDNGSDAKTSSAAESKWAEKQIFTTGEAAEVCNVSQQTIIRCFDSGRLSGFRVPGSRFRRIPRADLIRFMRDNHIPLDPLEPGALRVLVVDDEPEIIALFRDTFGADERFELETAANGYDAGRLTESFKPEVVFLDYMLPDINGDLVCQRIREHDELRNTKIIFISGVVEPTEVDRLLAAGADEFVKKPFDIRKLMDAAAAQISG